VVAQKGGVLVSRKDREKEFKKQLIADAAFQLFSNSSFEAVTVEDIARQAEFGKGTLYLYFANKEEILLYIFTQGIEELVKNIAAQCADEPDVREALNRYMSLQYGFYRQYHTLVLSLLRRKFEGALPSEHFADAMRKLDQTTELIAGILERGTREGIFVAFDPNKLARVMKNVLKGFSLEALERKGLDDGNDLELIKMVLSYGIIDRGGEK
jgi:AcrR family transcriptional regulator